MRNKDIQDNKYKVLLSPREDRKKKKQPRTFKTWVKLIINKIKKWRLIGYIVIGVSLFRMDMNIDYIILQMFLLILFTELHSRGVSKKDLDELKKELNVEQEIEYQDKENLAHQGLIKQEEKDLAKSKQDIEDNVTL